MTLRVAFMGTPDFAVAPLNAIASGPHDIVCVYTRPPAVSGRGLKQRRSPVQDAAERHGLPVEIPARLRDPSAAVTLAAYRPDVAVVAAYGLLLPAAVLQVPRLGCVNLHASVLPRWRGAAPIQRAVMAGDAETGVAVMRMEEGLDTGPVASVGRTPIGPDETAGELHDRLSRMGADLIGPALDALETGRLRFMPQPDEGVTYAGKITNDEARIAWSRPAREVHDHVRGLSPFPGAFFEADLGRGPERIKVLRTARADGSGEPGRLLDGSGVVACGLGAVALGEVQRAGRSPMGAADFLRGVRLLPGDRLG